MPRRRGKSIKLKQKRAITTRLMEINLRLDDYVYKKMPISTADAQTYINEISVYKTQCLKDERSLQVIEKLTRCMKFIIDEEQNENECKQQKNTTTKVTASYCPSPTYSIVEEDVEHKAYNNEIRDSRDMEQKGVGANFEQATIDTINLCGEEDNEREHAEFNIDVEIHRAISNLSIRDQDPLNTSDVWSQSILDNVDQLHTEILPDVEVRDHHATEKAEIAANPALLVTTSASIATPSYGDVSILDLIKSKCNNNEKSLTRIIDKSSKNNLNFIDLTEDVNICRNKQETVKREIRVGTNFNEENNDATVAKENKKKVFPRDDKKINKNTKGKLKNQVNIETKKKTKRQVNKLKKNKNQINAIKKGTILLKTKVNLNNLEPNSTVDTAKPSCEINKDKISSNNKQESVDTNFIDISTESRRIKKHCVSVYSNNTENDLSWVENVRFVRVIEKEEIDITLSGLHETFWEDLSFPNIWDEHEFDI